MKYTAVIFDLDGTLINSLEDLADSANEALAKYGFKGHAIEAYKKFIGNGVRELIKNALPKESPNNLVDSILDEYRTVYNKNYVNKTRQYDNIHNMLEDLKRLGIKMAVCSNKPNKPTNEIVHKIIGTEYFEVIFGEREGVAKKPDPASLLEAARLMGVQPKETIYLGDSGGDMVSAKNAGMFAAGALWGFRGETELVECGAQILLCEPMALVEFIKLKYTP